MANLGTYAALWDEYPDYANYPDPGQVKKLIGGHVDEDWIVNTCAIRLSRTLNYNGIRVPSNYAGLSTVSGADKRRYAFRVREVHRWLGEVLPKPAFDLKKKQGEAFDKSQLAALKGIIGFDIHFADATGHLDLWDGRVFSSEYHMSTSYWDGATRIWLWKAL